LRLLLCYILCSRDSFFDPSFALDGSEKNGDIHKQNAPIHAMAKATKTRANRQQQSRHIIGYDEGIVGPARSLVIVSLQNDFLDLASTRLHFNL